MIFRLTRAANCWRLRRAIARVLAAPPLVMRAGGVTLVSQLRRTDVLPYLLAAKSFARQVPVGDIRILDDGSLQAEDHARLREHLPGARIEPIAAIDTGPCPRGGTWERLVRITELAAERYVVQLDADILVTGPIGDVLEAIAARRCFTLGTGPDFHVVTTAEAAAAVAAEPSGPTQVAAEQALAHVPSAVGGRYVRGSSGFAGFAPGAAPRARLEAFSTAMQARLGTRWTEWGTEQVASNFLVASAEGGLVLPWPKYCCFYGGEPDPRSVLFHFLGTWRFAGGVYARLGRRVVAELAAG